MLDAPYVAQSSPNGKFATNQPGETDDDTDAQGYLPVSKLRRQYIDYLAGKQLEIEEQKQARHYYHGSHWTADQIRILRARRQPIVTYNRIARKINGISGLLDGLRQDPKAYPRNPHDEEGAEVATATVRYVCEKNDWKTLDGNSLMQACIDGIAGVELFLISGDKGDPDIGLRDVFADDWFYDARSTIKPDFSDGRYHGIAKWLDEDDAVDLFPDKEDDIRGLIEQGSELTTYADREFKYQFVNDNRVRMVEHWYKHRGGWCWAFYIGSTLLDQGPSPFVDENGKQMSRFLMFSAAIDQDGDRYGFVRNLKGPNDELNQRRSKALHISNSRRIIANKGAVEDVETARREWARPDGWVETNKGFDITPDNTQPDLVAQVQLMTEAKDEIESFANVNPALIAAGNGADLSGRAINLLQKAGIAELGPFIRNYRSWKLRVYRAIWNAAQRHWTAERWIRVTDDKQVAQFIQVNGLQLDQWGRPQLVNALGALDVDIIMDEGPDTMNMMADAFDVLSKQPPGSIPLPVLVELMPIAGSVKQRLLQMLQAPPDPLAQEAKVAEVERVKAEVGEKRASALEKTAKAAMEASKAHATAQEVAVFRAGLADAGSPLPQPQAPGQLPMRLDQMAGLAGQGTPPGLEPAQLTTAPPAMPPAFQP